MTGWIVGAVAAGMLAGHFVLPAEWAAHCGALITLGLCLILFLVGVDMGRQGNVWRDIRQAGARVLAIPVAAAAGTLAAAAVAGLFLPMSVKDAMAASAGFGWYSLAPMLLADYSPSVSAVAFLSNVMREIFSIIAIPFVAKYLGYVECAALPGAAAMDTCLPVIARYSGERCAILAVFSGMCLTLLVPLIVPALMALR